MVEADIRQAVERDRHRGAAEVFAVWLAGPHEPLWPAGPRGRRQHVAEVGAGVDDIPAAAVVLEGGHGRRFEHLAGEDRLRTGAVDRGAGDAVATMPVVGDHAAEDMRVGALVVGVLRDRLRGCHRRRLVSA